MITDASTMIDKPVSDPRAIVGACCVLDFIDISEFTAGLGTPPRVGCVSSASVFSGSYCIWDEQTVVVIIVWWPSLVI